MSVHPGSFCSPPGATGETSAGTPMVCAVRTGPRARWGSDAGDAKAARRQLLRAARDLGLRPKRGLAGEQIMRMIDDAKRAETDALPEGDPWKTYPEPKPAIDLVEQRERDEQAETRPLVSAQPLTAKWFEQRTAVFEHDHPQNRTPAEPGTALTDDVLRRAHRQAALADGRDPDDRSGTSVMVAALRRHLPLGYTREEVDEAITRWGRTDGARVFPESNQKVLLDVERQGALWRGNQWQHVVWAAGPETD